MIQLPPQEVLQGLLHYDPETGRLYWKPRGIPSYDAQFSGREAFTAITNGYRRGRLLGRDFRAHRIAFKIYHGREPIGEIDHINGRRTDNRICNLREASRTENGRNLRRSRRNKSGETGVSFRQERNAWRAYIRAEGRQVFLGYFQSKEDAIASRKTAEVRLGYHPNHGRAA
jgi:hypothetical protein